jgi:hypothetical protein
MLHAYFCIPSAGHGDQITNDHTQLSNFMNIYDTDHSTITGKPYLAVEQKNETENAETDFISFYDIFGAVNY